MSEYEVTSFEVQTTTDLAAGPPPIGIKYYELSNSGAGIVIYPQLRSASNPAGDVFWDGRGMKGFGYLLPIGCSVIVNLDAVHVQENKPFVLSSNTVAGSDRWDTSQSFVFDPESDLIASADRTGDVGRGALCAKGTRQFRTLSFEEGRILAKNAASPLGPELFQAIAFELLRPPYEGPGTVITAPRTIQFIGKVNWEFAAAAATVTCGIALMVYSLSSHGILIESKNTVDTQTMQSVTTWILKVGLGTTLKPQEVAATTGVPANVKEAWNDAIKAAKPCHPKDLGIERQK